MSIQHIKRGAIGDFSIPANVKIEVRCAKTNRLITLIEKHNLIVAVGLDHVRDLIGGNVRRMSHIAVGTDATAPASGQTALVAEVFRDKITRRTPSTAQIKLQLFIASGDANGNLLVEAAIFDRFALGTMMSRITFASIDKTVAITVTITWTFDIAES